MNTEREITGARIELSKLIKQYSHDTPPAVDGVDLIVEPGEFVSLLGPSGSGKTTTLNMIAGLEQPTSGQIFFDGVDVSRRPAHKRNIGMVFQNYALFPHLSVGSNIAFPLKRRGVANAEVRERVLNSLSVVGLEGYADRKADQLSGGQRQRVALARALVYEPAVLLLDEPLGALDKSLRGQLQLEIRRLHQRLGITIVFVTHDQGEALSMSDRIAIFNEGAIRQLGSGDELYRRPKDLFVTRFLGEANVIPAGRAGPLLDALGGAAEAAASHIVIRPENIVVGGSAMANPRGEYVTVQGTVTDFINLGDSFEMAIDTPALGSLRAKMLAVSPLPFPVGEQVDIHVSRSDLVVV